MRKIIYISLFVSSIIAIIFLMGFSINNHKNRICSLVDIKIDYGKREFASEIMLTISDIEQFIRLNFDSLKGKPLNNLNIESIENNLAKISFVKDIDVYSDLNGKINIKLSQRRPIMRIYTRTGNDFYIDESGIAIPVKPGFPARVIIVNGYIDDLTFMEKNIDIMNKSYDSIEDIEKLRNLYLLVKEIDKDEFLRKEITQIEIDAEGEITMIPLVGQHIIVMESLDDYAKKLNKLKIFYTQGLRNGGWGQYQKINIEFKNQLVCTKN